MFLDLQLTNLQFKGMKQFIALFAVAAMFAACENQQGSDTTDQTTTDTTATTSSGLNYYGDSITTEGAIEVNQLAEIVQRDGQFEGKVTTVIHETCKMKGCWMKVDLDGDEDMRVTFKDYGFFVPKEGVDGKEVIMEGIAYLDTTSVEMLRHYAEDAGKTPEEIETITEPEYALAFEAIGVIIKQ